MLSKADLVILCTAKWRKTVDLVEKNDTFTKFDGTTGKQGLESEYIAVRTRLPALRLFEEQPQLPLALANPLGENVGALQNEELATSTLKSFRQDTFSFVAETTEMTHLRNP